VKAKDCLHHVKIYILVVGHDLGKETSIYLYVAIGIWKFSLCHAVHANTAIFACACLLGCIY
jgi:hypothetical protein